MEKFFILALTVLLLFSGCINQTGSQDDKYITLGFVGPLSGDAAGYGEVEKEVMMIALDEINAAGGVNGKELKVIYEDGKCNGKDAAAAANKLINLDKVKVIFGGACSGETLAMAPLVEKSEVILFSAYSSNPDITRAGDFVFRNSYNDADAGKVSAQQVWEAEIKKIAMLTEDTAYAKGFEKVFVAEYTKLGGEVTAQEHHLPEARDFRSQLTKMKATSPEAYFLNPQAGKVAGNSVKQLREIGITEPVFSTFAFSGQDTLDIAGEAAEGVMFSDTPSVEGSNPKAEAVYKKYIERYGKRPAYDFPTGSRYDSVYIIADAIRKVGLDTKKIRDYLYALKDYNGALGTYGFDENGDVVGVSMVRKVIIDGRPALEE